MYRERTQFAPNEKLGMQPKPLRVCAYARVSTDKDDQANSYQGQVRYFTEYIQQHKDWQFAGIYADEGISGTSTKKRESFRRMISDADNGLIDLILTKEVSRFARNTVDTLSYTRELKKRGVYVFFVNDNINTKDNDGELRLSIMATIAQDESRKTSERVKWGQKRRMEQGIVFGRDLLGYTVKNGKLELNEPEAEIVRLIFSKFLMGKGTHVIARELREAGIKSKYSNDWSNTYILKILRNEKYVGDLCQKKTFTPDYLDHEKKYNHGEEEKVYIQNHHPEIAIIDRTTWDKTQAELARRSPTDEQKCKHSNRYWCSGKILCGECGQRFVSRTKQLKNGTTYKAWRCYAAANHGTQKTDMLGNIVGCNGASIGDRTLRLLTVYAMRLIKTSRDAIKRDLTSSIGEILNVRNETVDREKIQRNIELIQKKKTRIIDLTVSGSLSEADMKRQNDLYSQEIDRLTSELNAFDNSDKVQDAKSREISEYIDRIDALTEFDEGAEELLHEALDRVVVYNDKLVDIYLSCIPFGISLRYKTSGKGDSFKVEVEAFETIEQSVQF